MIAKKIATLVDDEVLESQKIPQEPNLYKVIIYNDDKTTQDFVVEVLMKVFMKNSREATEIMWKVHSDGIGIAGIFVYDVARSRISSAEKLARSVNFPLLLNYEPI